MKYSEALREAQAQIMRYDESVFVCGLGVPDPKGVFGSTIGLEEEFGPKRVFDTPACENATVGMMIGASFQGMRPIRVNQRLDFTLLALDQIINHAAKWKWMFGGVQRVPIVIRVIVGRGWGQGAQHSQTMHALFAHIPGLKVVAPVTPKDVKGLLISSIEDDDPVIFIEHRRLYDEEGDVPQGIYRVPIGKANVVQEGVDITLVALSHMVVETEKAGIALKEKGISAEIIDMRSLRPLDMDTILNSVKKTGRLVVIDDDWKLCGIAGEIIAALVENDHKMFKAPPVRLTWPDMPTPTSVTLESAHYTTAKDIYEASCVCLNRSVEQTLFIDEEREQPFSGPF
jgi:pyruvate dehydrogenase E1 component beta subunit